MYNNIFRIHDDHHEFIQCSCSWKKNSKFAIDELIVHKRCLQAAAVGLLLKLITENMIQNRIQFYYKFKKLNSISKA
ncbi:hypothetical protein BLOT_010113 [Blomia tropicalis]|nr:hypothetical protein BLOT_010113 [Blomia tropicalis]